MRLPCQPAQSTSKVALAVLGAGAFVVILGGIMAVKLALGPSSPARASGIDTARFSAEPSALRERAESTAVPLDAGKASP